MQNHYVIGDIHGDYQQLLALVNKLPKEENLIFVGDVIDRGAESPIFNIYGHTNVAEVVIGQNFVCLDTGCGRSDGSRKLSAYFVETGEVLVSR